LKSSYLVSGQSSIVLTQTIDDSVTESSASIDFNEGQAIDETTVDGINFIGYVNDHTGYAIAFYDNITLEIRADNITYEQLTEFMRNIRME
jgi:hypothetical protein